MEKKIHLEGKLKKARDFESQGKFLHAVQVYQSVLDEYPGFFEAYFNLADLYEHLGNIDSAINLMNSYIQSRPEDMKARLYFGQFLLRNNKWEEAIEVMSYIVPEEEPIVSFFLGYSHFMLKDYELAKINFQNFLSFEDQPELKHEAILYLSKLELHLGNYESAINYAKKTEAVYSNYWELNLIYAVSYYNLGMFAHAVVPVEKSIKLNPKESSPYEWAGKIYLKLGDYIRAEKYLLKFIESIEDASADIYTKLAEACLKTKKTKKALDYFDVALKLDPGNKAAAEGKKNASIILNKNLASDG